MNRLVLQLSLFSLIVVDKIHGRAPIDSRSGSLSPSSSCVGKEDGDYWLQLYQSDDDDESFLPLKLTCSKGYVILDYKKDNKLENYFTSFEKWHYAVAGAANRDPANWQDWFIPSDSNSDFLLSPDCNTCEETHERQVFDSKTTYWMNGALNKLYWGVIFVECSMDYDTYQCYDCGDCVASSDGDCTPKEYQDTASDFSDSGSCAFTVQSSDQEVAQNRHLAMSSKSVDVYGFNYKPSIGMDGRFCVCYKPGSDEFENPIITTKKQGTYVMNEEKQTSEEDASKTNESKNKNKSGLIVKNWDNVGDDNEDDELDDKRDTNVVYLSQNDFEYGTYRITESGTYVITEDIVFDFNGDDDYWPTINQNEDYPGSGEYRDPYHLGFFAGITVESDYVTIDLNSKQLSQSLNFYYQQRWFGLIELGNQQFMPGQGPAFFGSDFISVSNVEIMNGVLGLTSHFGIHGNYASNLIVENVHIRDFVTHGIQLNGWNNVLINNCDVGPSSEIEYLRGDYGHGRLWLQRLKAIREAGVNDGKSIKNTVIELANHDSSLTVDDIIDELELSLTLAFDYAVTRANMYNNNNNKDDDEFIFDSGPYVDSSGYDEEYIGNLWRKTKLQFVQESGFPSSSSVTGIFLNCEASSVFSYQMHTTKTSQNGILSNVYIHDITHDISEMIRFTKYSEKGQFYPTPLNSDFPAESAFGGKNELSRFAMAVQNEEDSSGSSDQFKYDGLPLSDALLAMGTFSDDWDILGFMEIDRYTEHDLELWAFGRAYPSTDWRFTCNQDIMGHSGKGLLGLRMDGIENILLKNIKISNLNSKSRLGSNACGEYSYFSGAGSGAHFKQRLPMQYGFSGNNLQAMSIISSTNVHIDDRFEISNINSDYGEGSAISLWTANAVNINENAFIKINGVTTGTKLTKGSFTYYSEPNRSPEACGVRLEIDSNQKYASNLYLYESSGGGGGSNSVNVKESLNNFETNIIVCNVNGHESCLGDASNGKTLYGKYLSDDSSVCDSIDSIDDLNKYVSSSTGIGENSEYDGDIIFDNNNNNNSNNSHNNNMFSFSNNLVMFVVIGCLCIILFCGLYWYWLVKSMNSRSNDKTFDDEINETSSLITPDPTNSYTIQV